MPPLFPLLTCVPSYCCKLIVDPEKLNPFAIRQIRTLSTKHPAWGGLNGTPPIAARPETINRAQLSTFRMNTCKSVSKQRTLSTFRMNTYEKPGGGASTHDQDHDYSCYSEGPSGRKYCVPFTGSCRRRNSCCKSSLRSTKSISDVLITSRSEAAYRKKKCS